MTVPRKCAKEKVQVKCLSRAGLLFTALLVTGVYIMVTSMLAIDSNKSLIAEETMNPVLQPKSGTQPVITEKSDMTAVSR